MCIANKILNIANKWVNVTEQFNQQSEQKWVNVMKHLIVYEL